MRQALQCTCPGWWFCIAVQLGKLLVLRLVTWRWSHPETSGALVLLPRADWMPHGRELLLAGDAPGCCCPANAACALRTHWLPLAWCAAGTAPGPRSAHAAALYRDRYMLVFGGGSGMCVHDNLQLCWLASAQPGRLDDHICWHNVHPCLLPFTPCCS